MRIATITNWAYGITVGLTLASGSAMLMASSADRVERQAVQQRQVFDTLSDEVENDAWALSDLARLYVIKPSPETLTQYQQLQQTDKSIEQRLGGLKDNGASREELALLQDGLRIADELQDEQQAALAHVARGDAPAAIAVLYWSACRRRSIASARCLSIAPPSLSTRPPSARGSGVRCRKSWSA